MRAFAVLVLVLGLGLAGGAAYYVFAQVQAAEARLGQGGADSRIDLERIVIASADLKFGQPLTEDDVMVVEWPVRYRPENAVSDAAEVLPAEEDGEPRIVLRRMEPGEPVLTTKITGFGQKATVAALLSPGMRAHTIPVDAANSVGGFILPGTRIDVFLTMRDRREGPTTRVLMQDLEVIAVDQDTDPDRIEARVARTVTVQGTPEQVRELTLAANIGTLSIALRGFGSDKVADLGPLDRSSLLGEVVAEAEPEPEPEPEPAPMTVRVRRGNQVDTKTFQ